MTEAVTSPSPFVGAPQPLTASDDEIRAALLDAELPPLLPALAYLTGDLGLLREHLKVDPLLGALPQCGLTDAQQSEIRDLAFAALVAYRDAGSTPAAPPSEHDLARIMEHCVGGGSMHEYVPLLDEELAFRGEDRRAPGWTAAAVAPGRAISAIIIGAGMSGLLAAHRLGQAGIPFTILEKNDDVGGTWLENTYPGCRVDNPNHNYSYSFAQRHDWPFHFSTADVLHGYFRACADEFGIRPHIRFGTEVLGAQWSEADARWRVQIRAADGTESEVAAEVLISAVGQLNRPLLPDIEGIGTFAGPAFHSARWDHSVDLAGKRVAVIGTGASAAQFVPEIAPVARELHVFQRTPPWFAPTPEYRRPVGAGLRWCFANIPSYAEWNRFWIFWRMGDGALEGVRVDPEWSGGPGSVSAANDLVRMLLVAHLENEYSGRPDLLAAAIPDYPPAAKRLIRDDGAWPRALRRDNVQLRTESIAAVTPTGLRTADGADHDYDVIIYGTGFAASHFLAPMRVTGRDGIDLHEHWAGEPRAYLGVTVPDFPNFFCLYGPNTNIVINGSIIYFSECGVRYILGCLRLLLEGGHRTLDVRGDVHDAFNAEIDAANDLMAWGAASVNSWYKNASGRVTQNWPLTLLEYWQRTLAPDPADYALD